MWWALPTAQVVSQCFILVESFQPSGNFCLKSSTFFTPSPSKECEKGKKWHFWTKKGRKYPRHLAMFAENYGGVYCAKPQIFWTFTEAWKHFWKKLKSLPKEVVLLLFYSLGLCILDVLTFQISLTSSCLPQIQLMVGFKEKNPQRESTGLGVAQGGVLLQWLICSQRFGVFLLQKETQWINALWKLESEIFCNGSRVIILP